MTYRGVSAAAIRWPEQEIPECRLSLSVRFSNPTMPIGGGSGPTISPSTKPKLPEEVYAETWRRLFDGGEYEPNGFIALLDGKPVGLTHYLYHRSGWSLVNNCYLQDLFADPNVRGKGVGAALIEAVSKKPAR